MLPERNMPAQSEQKSRSQQSEFSDYVELRNGRNYCVGIGPSWSLMCDQFHCVPVGCEFKCLARVLAVPELNLLSRLF
jgi:hypothetical protein